MDEELKTLSQLPMILEEVFSWCKHEPRTLLQRCGHWRALLAST